MIGIGVVGAGQFARFACRQASTLDEVRLVAVTDVSDEAARAFADQFAMEVCASIDELLDSPGVDLVYVATPPSTHAQYARLALTHGKHVTCEKPLALDVKACDELVALAEFRGLLLVVNMMQRYNPMYDVVRELLEQQLLGSIVHASFENDAISDTLPPDHWFWDEEISGGIFVEHAVHFFDLLEGWLGRGEVVAAWQQRAASHRGVDRAWCAMRHGSVTSTMYHGFHQRTILERQRLRILCSNGDIELEGWIPIRITVRCAVDTVDVPAVRTCIETIDSGCELSVRQHDEGVIALTIGIDHVDTKAERYGQMVRDLFADQLAWVTDRTHPRRMTAELGRRAVELACRASDVARTQAGQ